MAKQTFPAEHRLRQLAGPGVDGLEREPHIFHFDISGDEVRSLVLQPGEFLDRLGLERSLIAPKGVLVITFIESLDESSAPNRLEDNPRKDHCCVATADGGLSCTQGNWV